MVTTPHKVLQLRGHRSRFLVGIALLASLVCALVFAPGAAYARSRTVESVDIHARVDIDGHINVEERRTYSFNGSYHGITWELPEGMYEGREVTSERYEVFVITEKASTQLYWAEDGTKCYRFGEDDDSDVLTIYWDATDETVTFMVCYGLDNLVSRWADVAELYWQYVPADSGAPTWHNVTLEVELPVATSETVVAGDNVRAWGHGPLGGVVTVDPDVVRFECAEVEPGDYLEARVVYPQEWAPLVSQVDEAKLDGIIEEEAAWAKEANAKRARDRALVIGVPGVMFGAGAGSVILQQVRTKLRRRQPAEPTFTDEYLRDVPSSDHPVVWGLLMGNGHLDNDDFAATLMRLADKGCVSIDAVRDGSSKSDWRIAPTAKGAVARLDAVDAAAFDLLFETVPSVLGTEEAEAVLVSQFEDAAKADPGAYSEAYRVWGSAAADAYRERGLEKNISQEGDLVVGAVGLIDIALASVLGFVGLFVGVPEWVLCIAVVLLFAAAIWCIWHHDDGEKETILTQEGADLKAKLEALRRWLKDFTRLDEAVPTDVVLWNRLLVAATELGVAKEVVRQLRVSVPALFANTDFVASSWFEDTDTFESGFDLPCSLFASAASNARSIACSTLGSSTSSSYDSSYDTYDSSYDGSGGGFSDGGGGGFSGGGRGDAF